MKSRILVFFVVLLSEIAFGQEYLAIKNANIIFNAREAPIPNGTIIIMDGIIAQVGNNDEISIPENIKVIDASGKWVIPGLIETHSHSKSKTDFKRGLALGITTAHVLPTNPDTTMRLEIWASKPESKSPRLVQNSWMFSGLWPDDIAPGTWKILKPVTTAEAITQVEKIKSKGFSAIKIFMEDGNVWHYDPTNTKVLSDSLLKTIIDRAHELNLRVYGHAWDTIYYNQLVRAKVDAVIHPAVNAVIDDEIWQMITEQNMVWITTASILERIGAMGDYYSRILADPKLSKLLNEKSLEAYKEYSKRDVAPFINNFPVLKTKLQGFYDTLKTNTMKARGHGVILALGSDNAVGFGTHIEMEILQDFGLSPRQILHAATFGSASALGMYDKIGSLEEGKIADLVILNKHPLLNIKNTRDVQIVIKSGTMFKKEDLFNN